MATTKATTTATTRSTTITTSTTTATTTATVFCTPLLIFAATMKKKTTRRKWSTSEEEKLKQLFPDYPARMIAEVLNRSESSIYQRARILGLEKSEAFWKSELSGRQNRLKYGKATRFKKGQAAWNKGKEFSAGGRSPETRFKKGNLPHNTRENGAISIRVCKDKWPYKWIRVQLGKWVMLHRHVWEQANGPIPKGHIVQFKDGNTMNCELDNLVLVSRQQNMKANTIHNYPEEVKGAIRTLGKLKKSINHAKEQNN